MAPLKVIGASLGRTGTTSLRDALNMLGYNTFHGMDFAMNPALGLQIFTDSFYHPDKHLDWDALYEGFDGAVDLPTALFIGPLMRQYPDSKFILVERDFDKWYNSMKKTVYWVLCVEPAERLFDKDLLKFFRSEIFLDGIFKDKESFLDKERVRAIFEKHNNWVKENVPADRLLIMKLSDGWDPLCAFLGKQVPDVPFPCVNSTEEFEILYKKQVECKIPEYPMENLPKA